MLVEAGSTEDTIIEFTAPRLAASMQRRQAVAVAGSDAGAGAGAGSQRSVHAVAACSPPAKRVAERMRCHSRRQPPASHACFSMHSPCVRRMCIPPLLLRVGTRLLVLTHAHACCGSMHADAAIRMQRAADRSRCRSSPAARVAACFCARRTCEMSHVCASHMHSC